MAFYGEDTFCEGRGVYDAPPSVTYMPTFTTSVDPSATMTAPEAPDVLDPMLDMFAVDALGPRGDASSLLGDDYGAQPYSLAPGSDMMDVQGSGLPPLPSFYSRQDTYYAGTMPARGMIHGAPHPSHHMHQQQQHRQQHQQHHMHQQQFHLQHQHQQQDYGYGAPTVEEMQGYEAMEMAKPPVDKSFYMDTQMSYRTVNPSFSGPSAQLQQSQTSAISVPPHVPPSARSAVPPVPTSARAPAQSASQDIQPLPLSSPAVTASNTKTTTATSTPTTDAPSNASAAADSATGAAAPKKPRARRVKLTPEEREARRKQRLAMRKQRKSVREKARRSKENDYYEELADLCGLPKENRDKATILEAVIKAIDEGEDIALNAGAHASSSSDEDNQCADGSGAIPKLEPHTSPKSIDDTPKQQERHQRFNQDNNAAPTDSPADMDWDDFIDDQPVPHMKYEINDSDLEDSRPHRRRRHSKTSINQPMRVTAPPMPIDAADLPPPISF